jgi:hypothetical protein
MRFFFSITFQLFTLALFCQNTTCLNFRTGQYKYANSEYAEWTVKRTDSTQIEISSKTGMEIYSIVKWKSDCSYTLTCKKVLNPNRQDLIGKVFEISIIETLPDRYKCISKSNEIQSNNLYLEMIRIK